MPRDLTPLEDAMTRHHRSLVTAALLVGLPLTLAADTLYLRNGTRIEGDLIAVRGATIEFEERRGFGGSRTVRIDRSEVDRIEFDGYGGGWGSGGGSSGGSNWNNGSGWGGAAGRPSGLRERGVAVSATMPWTDSGIDLRAGQTIYVEASGRVRWGRDRRDGPEGEKNSPYNGARPLPSRPGGALIARIGDDIFFIGDDRGPIRVRNRGRLYLGVNDEYLEDNSGSFRVTVFY
jgi:hypothetical protein